MGHWQRVYETTSPADVSWHEGIPERSLSLIRATGIALDGPILDVGGGASTLVDHLLDAGYSDLTVVDVAPAALRHAQARLGARAASVHWVAGDVLAIRPARRFALWHDRAMLHFLVEERDRERYAAVLHSALLPGGHVVLAEFGPDAPTRCSGLPVRRYSADEVGALLGPGFAPRSSSLEAHRTPGGDLQQYLYGWWQLEPA